MSAQKRILYLQHADAIGGSVISLREVITDALARGYHCTVVSRNKEVAGVYEAIGAQSRVGVIAQLNHNTAFHYKVTPFDFLRLVRALMRTVLSFIHLRRIVKETQPDIVHLNSSTLFLYILCFRLMGISTILHVREYVVNGYFGLRKAIIRAVANRATFILYISEYELELLKTNPEKSLVIYNYVHEKEFTGPGPATAEASGKQKFSIITLGGLFNLKGGKTILQSIAGMNDSVELVVLGCDDPRVNGTEIRRIDGEQYLNDIVGILNHVNGRVRFAGKVQNPAPYIRQADALLFWAAAPHFPRPVFEAWLLRKPVLYFNPCFRNRIISGENVVVVEEATGPALSKAITRLRENEARWRAETENTFVLAKENFTEKNFERMDRVYQRCLCDG